MRSERFVGLCYVGKSPRGIAFAQQAATELRLAVYGPYLALMRETVWDVRTRELAVTIFDEAMIR
jgi:hypothetical protein